MKGPAVYPFAEVLRQLRNQAGVSILRAQELTSYGNYERWESGQTKVGADHLINIGDAFDLGNDLWRLVYAWLADRLVPHPGCEPAEVSDARLDGLLSTLPEREVDLGEFADMVLESLTPAHLAQLGLIARYGRGYAGTDRRLVLPPTGRGTMPMALPDVPVLRQVYGDVERDVLRYVARTFILGGFKLLPDEPQRQVARYTWLLLSEPEWFMRLLAAGRPPPTARKRGLDWLAWIAARLAPVAGRMAHRELEDLRRLAEAVEGEPVSLDDVKAMIRQAVRDDLLWESSLSPTELDEWTQLVDLEALPEPDPGLNRQVRALHDVVQRAARRAISEELDDARATADPRTAMDALHLLQADAPDR